MQAGERRQQGAITPTEEYPDARRNFTVLSLRGALFRVGWLFKNEGQVVSSFLKALGASNFVLSLFPLMNRTARALPQALIQGPVGRLERKKYINSAALIAFSFCWLGVGLLVLGGAERMSVRGLLILFVVVYTLGMLALSVSNLSTPLLTGRLIPPTWRGRLNAATVLPAVPVGIVLSLLVIKPVATSCTDTVRPYGWLFLGTAAGFLAAGLVVLLLRERTSPLPARRSSFLKDSRKAWRNDPNFRNIMIVRSMTFLCGGCVPFFTSYGSDVLESVGVEWEELVAYNLVALETGKVAGSLLLGYIADWWGNRRALLVGAGLGTLWPITAVVFGRLVGEYGISCYYYTVVFFVGGMFFSTFVFTSRYVIEASPGRKQPVYLAAGGVAMMSSAVLVPPIGLLADSVGLEPVFAIVAALMVGMGLVASRLEEPRFQPTPPTDPAVS